MLTYTSKNIATQDWRFKRFWAKDKVIPKVIQPKTNSYLYHGTRLNSTLIVRGSLLKERFTLLYSNLYW